MRAYLQSFDLLTEAEIAMGVQAGRTAILKKGEYFMEEGDVCDSIAFVVSGFFRSFYRNTKEEEITYCFTFAGSFVAAYSSFISQATTKENICAMTDAEIFVIPRAAILKFEQNTINWLKLTKTIAEQEYIKMEAMVFMLQKSTAEEKYRNLLKKHSEYLQLIPLHQLASYLGITQRHLSRIRRLV